MSNIIDIKYDQVIIKSNMNIYATRTHQFSLQRLAANKFKSKAIMDSQLIR